jgi:beta-galactosidase
MRLLENFNQNWLYCAEKIDLTAANDAFEEIDLPHSNKYYSQTYVDNQSYQFVSTYRKVFAGGKASYDTRTFLDFDGVMLEATVYLNGELLGIHKGGYTGFSIDLTDYLLIGENILNVYVDSSERTDIPPYGNVVDYLSFGGIYRDVTLRTVNDSHIQSAFAQTSTVLTQPTLDAEIELSDWREELRVEARLEDTAGKLIVEARQEAPSKNFRLKFPELENIELWSLDKPSLYNLHLSLFAENELVDNYSLRFGFREAEFRKDGSFYLNGQAIKLFGLNRHQTYPYIGAAAPKGLQELDADILKYELACNIVRTSHYAQSPHFLNRCDEIGLLVFEELAGWQHIGDEAWQKLVLQDLRAMIERDRHHPAIVLWGVRVNESPDNYALYCQTNDLAHELDPTRQTGGVRNFISSQFLEDVFTLNDFPVGIQDPLVKPHMITEFAGHMFPTKTWDSEERRVEHALRHIVKHNLQMGHPDVAGAIGWCAFDYHTHKEFGSGDRICYHGVMDIFRLPKLAAYFYRSQKSPQDEIVLQAASNWTMGDRSGGGNNPLMVFSNCEEIEVWIGEANQGRFRADVENYPHLPYPPFTLRWPEPYNPWGTAFADLIIRGYIGGECVAEQRIAADHLPHKLQVKASHQSLNADGADMLRIAVQVLDRYANVLPYQMRLVTFEIEGAARLIGENPIALIGGQAAVYLQAQKEVGTVKIRAHCAGLPSEELEISLHH